MRRILIFLAACAMAQAALAAPPAAPAGPQDSKDWLESQGLEATASKEFQEFEAIVARVKGAKDAAAAEERVVVFRQGKLVWQSNAKELVEADRALHAALPRAPTSTAAASRSCTSPASPAARIAAPRTTSTGSSRR